MSPFFTIGVDEKCSTEEYTRELRYPKPCPGGHTSIRQLKYFAIHYMKRNRQIIRRKCSLKGRFRQKRISFGCFQFCYTIHQSRMQSSPFQKPILSGSQSTIYAFVIETESLSDRSCIGVFHRPPKRTILAPFQQELRICQGFSTDVHFLNENPARAQGIGERNSGCFSGLHGHSLWILTGAGIQAILRNQLLNLVFSGL